MIQKTETSCILSLGPVSPYICTVTFPNVRVTALGCVLVRVHMVYEWGFLFQEEVFIHIRN